MMHTQKYRLEPHEAVSSASKTYMNYPIQTSKIMPHLKKKLIDTISDLSLVQYLCYVYKAYFLKDHVKSGDVKQNISLNYLISILFNGSQSTYSYTLNSKAQIGFSIHD